MTSSPLPTEQLGSLRLSPPRLFKIIGDTKITEPYYCKGALQYSKLALEYLNKEQMKSKGPFYKLVKPIGSAMWGIRGCSDLGYHVNFEAKPKGARDDKIQLFFAEIKEKHGKKERVTMCCPVKQPSPDSIVNRLQGCLACDYSWLCHPPAGGFDRGHTMHTIFMNKPRSKSPRKEGFMTRRLAMKKALQNASNSGMDISRSQADV